jgi:hypothetical protein
MLARTQTTTMLALGAACLVFPPVRAKRPSTTPRTGVPADRDGSVCQPKMPLAAEFAFTSGDEIVRRSDGTIVWATLQGSAVSLVTLTPG